MKGQIQIIKQLGKQIVVITNSVKVTKVNMRKLTLKQVTEYIREKTKDTEVELCKGESYFYFFGGRADEFFEQGVYVNKLSALSLDDWLRQYQGKLKEGRIRRASQVGLTN